MLNRRRIPVVCVLAGLLSLLAPVSVSQAAEQTVVVGVNKANQPFTLPESDSGLLVEVIRAAFASQSVPVGFAYMPTLRLPLSFKEGMLDVLTNAKPENAAASVHTHWPVLTFHNQAITSKSRKLKLHSISDLGGLRVITFQGASKFLGPEFALMAENNPTYAEMTHMPSNMLTLNRTDVIISQPDIFRFNLTSEASKGMKVPLDGFDYHNIFAVSNQYWFGFHTEAVRDTFERGIAAIYASGEIDGLFSKYHQLYGTSRDMFITLDCRFLKTNLPAACAEMQKAE